MPPRFLRSGLDSLWLLPCLQTPSSFLLALPSGDDDDDDDDDADDDSAEEAKKRGGGGGTKKKVKQKKEVRGEKSIDEIGQTENVKAAEGRRDISLAIPSITRTHARVIAL
ncbi:hypothetical protein ANTPLA_LOCUS5515 [Anthophora plagiata]